MNRREIFTVIAALAVAGFFFTKGNTEPLAGAAKNLLAGVFFIDSITESGLKESYAKAKNGNERIKIVIVPGHDGESWGTKFNGVKEADLNREAAEILADLLRRDREFEVSITRNANGYTPEFASYFANERKTIQEFAKKNVETAKNAIRSGAIERRIGVRHNYAPQEVGMRLHGINKWANEHDVSLVIHLHFNDDTEHPLSAPGEYSGFAIYVPERQFSNAKASRAVAESLFRELNRYIPVSNLPKESAGIVEDQNLIAIGSGNSLDAASLLIEYGYIYEQQFTNPRLRPIMMQEVATQTYFGIKKFFEPELMRTHHTTLLPFLWRTTLEQGTKSEEVLSLQAALTYEGLYPPPEHTKNDCTISGHFGPCTASAVKALQKKYSLEPAGAVGPLTRKLLNQLYGSPTAAR